LSWNQRFSNTVAQQIAVPRQLAPTLKTVFVRDANWLLCDLPVNSQYSLLAFIS
jgi:hypothetical protein